MRNFLLLYILIFILSVKNAYGQYAIAGVRGKIYTDIIPDKKIEDSNYPNPDNNYKLDLNKDGIDDLELKSHYYLHGVKEFDLYVMTLNSNTKLVGKVDSFLVKDTIPYWRKSTKLKMYDFSDTIKTDTLIKSAWIASEGSNAGRSYIYDEWINKGDKYFGVKYSDGNDEYYGWVKVEVQSAYELIIKDYSLGIPKIPCDNDQLICYPNPTNSIVYFQYCEEFYTFSKIAIFNIVGQLIIEGNFSATNPEIDLSGLANGCYYFNFYSDNNSIKRGKIIKAN